MSCDVSGLDGDGLTYEWRGGAGTIIGSGSEVTWVAPSCPEEPAAGDFWALLWIDVSVFDGDQVIARGYCLIDVHFQCGGTPPSE